jgi:hypothetical protein
MRAGTVDEDSHATHAAGGSDRQSLSRTFSLVLGGPLYQLFLKTRLARPPLELLRRRILAFVLVTWLPPALLAALSGRFASGPVPFVFDLTNLQFLMTVPLLLGAEIIIHRRLRLIVPEFVKRELVAPKDRPAFNDIVDRAMRLRNSLVAEVALLVLAFTGGYWLWRSYASLRVATWYILPSDGSMRLTVAGYWFAFVSLPLSRFVLLRWYFRLFIWYLFLWRVSRLRLRLNPLHADRAGGLGFLEQSAMAFSQVLFAQSTFVAMVLGNQIWHRSAHLVDFSYEVVASVVCLMLFVLAPLTFFVKQMVLARVDGLVRYGQLASRYTNAFYRKWLTASADPNEPLLGTSDIQSLADLANSYEVVRAMRVVPFDKTFVFRLAMVVALPLMPLTFAIVPVDKLLTTLIKVFV